ncbi:hypothetical protein EBME_1101 [bacterium endosymbiont of Mortierella elongata FMR23-6]|nr:hypothetical protein EBME_1101 [bacterium endosymbiont of Mortierella elongata FMR23-6]
MAECALSASGRIIKFLAPAAHSALKAQDKNFFSFGQGIEF